MMEALTNHYLIQGDNMNSYNYNCWLWLNSHTMNIFPPLRLRKIAYYYLFFFKGTIFNKTKGQISNAKNEVEIIISNMLTTEKYLSTATFKGGIKYIKFAYQGRTHELLHTGHFLTDILNRISRYLMMFSLQLGHFFINFS